MRRLIVAASVLVFLISLVGSAGAEPPAFTVASDSGPEGGTADFTVTLGTAAPAGGIELTYSTAHGTAGASDYTAVPAGTLTFAEGDTTKTISIDLTDDALDEDDETFTVTVAHAEGGDQTATGTIIDGDDPPTTTGITDPTVAEGETANFTVTLSGPSAKPITIQYSTVNGTAQAPGDFTAATGASTTIDPGATSGTISVATTDDAGPEPTESFTVTLDGGTNVSLGSDRQGVGTIQDNDVTPVASIDDVTVTEGHSGTTNATFTVSLTSPAAAPVQIRYSTANGSAMAGSDYVGKTNETVTIPQGASSATLSVQVNGDTFPESNETFFVDLQQVMSGPATIGADSRGVGTITDDDSTPQASIDDVTVTEGHSGTTNATFTVSLTSPAAAPVQIRYSTANGSATAGSDYVGKTNETVTIPQGASSATLSVQVNGDTFPESNETFFVDLQQVMSGPATIGADSRGVGTITDDDSTPQASINDVTVTEGAAGNTVNATFTVSLTSAAAAPVQIRYSTVNGSATAGSDFVGKTNETVTIPQNASSATLTVVVNGDNLPEGTGTPPSEQFFVDLQQVMSGPATIGPDSRGIGTITDDDSAPSASINDVTVTEGNTPSTTNATFTVSLSAAAPVPVQIRYSTVNNSATAPDDFVAATNQTVTIPQGATSANLTIVVNGDNVPEGTGTPLAETFFVDLQQVMSGPATISSDSRGIGTITDDDAAPSASINDATVTEGNSPTTVNATFTVTLSGPAPAPLQIRYSTVDNSAVAPDDFTAVTNGSVAFAQGATSATFNIVVKGDNVPEGSGSPRVEVFFVDLVGVTGPAVISSDFRGIGTITDDDAVPTVTAISDPTVTEGNSGQVDANFEVTLSGNAQAPVDIGYATADGSATAGSDYVAQSGTLRIPVGQSKGTISVKVNGDVFPEGNEDFHVDLTSASLAQLGADRRGTATITNDDAQPTLGITGGEVTEGTGNTVTLEFKVRLGAQTSQQVQVTATTSDGSATGGQDYQVKSEVLVWAPNTPANQLEKTFSVVVNGDSLDEADETVVVSLSSAQNAVIATGSASGTIKDNDNRSLLGVGNAEANEGTGGTTSKMTFKVTLSPASARTVTAHYATANGTATAGTDYEAKEGDLSFAPGETEKTIEVVILGDDINEENETVLVNLSSVSGAALAGGGGQGSGTIVDKNAPPSLSINDVVTREGAGASFTVTLAGTTLRTVSATFGTSEGSAKEGVDFLPRRGTVTFAPGEKTKTIEVTIFDDSDAELAETFSVGLGNPVNATITKASGTATIEANDQAEVAAQPTPLPPLPRGGVIPKPSTVSKATVFPSMILGPRTATLRKGSVRLTVTCNKTSPIACGGRILLQTTTKPALKLGQKSFSVKKGKKGIVTIVVARDVRTLIASLGTIKVKVVVYVKTNAKKPTRVDPGTINVRTPKGTSASRP